PHEKEHGDGGGRDDRHRQEREQRPAAIPPEVDEETPERLHGRDSAATAAGLPPFSIASSTASAARPVAPGGPRARETRSSPARMAARRAGSESRASPSRSRRPAVTSSCSSSGTICSPATMLTSEIHGILIRSRPIAKLSADVR